MGNRDSLCGPLDLEILEESVCGEQALAGILSPESGRSYSQVKALCGALRVILKMTQ